MLPFGRLRRQRGPYWDLYQISSWRDEIYSVARVAPDGVRPVVAVAGGGCPKERRAVEGARALRRAAARGGRSSGRCRSGCAPRTALHPAANLQPSYLPAIYGPRERAPFEAERVPALARMNPGVVVIGDSMAGSRIDPALLTRADRRASRRRSCMPAAARRGGISRSRTGSSPSGIRPRAVIVFFRDTNLTNVLFRIDATWSLDTAALEREDDLNAVVARRRGTTFYRVRDAFDRLYRREEARRWIEPAVNEWPARALIPVSPAAGRVPAAAERPLRPRRTCVRWTPPTCRRPRTARRTSTPSSTSRTLPLMLRDARQAGLTLVLVRVQRRPVGGRPPYQSPALQRYVAQAEGLRRERTAASSWTTPAIPRRRSISTRTATTCRARDAAATPSCSPPSLRQRVP